MHPYFQHLPLPFPPVPSSLSLFPHGGAAAHVPQLTASAPTALKPLTPPTYDFVDKAALPQGAKILSAAKARNGVVWVVTDRGAFRSGPNGMGMHKLLLPLSLKTLQPPVP